MDNTNTWITEPSSDAHHAALALARDADVLCLDCNTWRYAGNPTDKPASHASFFTQLQNVRALRPRETLLVHLSGHEDAPDDGYGWLDHEWQLHARTVWADQKLPGTVRVPGIGMPIWSAHAIQ